MPSPLALLRQLRPPADADPLTGFARTRDPLLLAELVRRHGGLVWGVCRRALPHRPDAEDAYQATWLVLAGNPGAVRSPAALPAFLHTVAVRTSRRVRHQRPVTAAVTDHLPARPDFTDYPALAALDEGLLRLPDRLRRPLLLCHLDGLTQAEAARTLELSLSTLKRRLDDGKDLLRTRLAGRGVDAAVLTTAGVLGAGAPAVTAGGATAAATILSTEVVSAMWVLKAKGWAAGLVVLAGIGAAGGGLILADAPAKPGAGPGQVLVPGGGEGPTPDAPPGEEASTPGGNFKVFAPDAATAGLLLREAERRRHDLAVRWLGKPLPAWSEPCVIKYRPLGSKDGGGATHFTFAAGRAFAEKMELFGALPKVVNDALPHEVMHAVLASHFKRAVPRWADEGIAVLAESPDSQRQHAVRNAELLNAGRGIPLRILFALEDYPKDMQALYSQGYAVCRWLLDRRPGGEAKLLEFVGRGTGDGWEPAAKAVYGFADLDAMQAEWIVSLKTPAAPPGPAPAKPADPPLAVNRGAVALPPQTIAEPLRAAYEEQFRELTRAIAEAEKAADIQQKIADAYRATGGAQTERLADEALVARYRENAANHRVELAKLKVEIAKLGPAAVPVTVVPARLIRERRQVAERYVLLDREIREIGAIPKEEASAFEANVSRAAQEMYEATCAEFPAPAHRLAAAREWYVVARDVEQYYKARADRGLNREQVALSAMSARVRAEVALFQAAAAVTPDQVAKILVQPIPAGFAGTVAKVADEWVTVKPAAGLRAIHVLRVSRGGKPAGAVVVILGATPDGPPEERKRSIPASTGEPDQALVIPLPNPDGSIPALQVGDEVRP